MPRDWNASLYQSSHSFVWEYGKDLLGLLAPQAGEHILDVGCGTGQLTAEISRAGAEVLGTDRSDAMIAQARQNFPELEFAVEDVCAMAYRERFEAVFSNAVLHWVTRADDAARAIALALKHGGRFVAEFGGRGNTQVLLAAVKQALETVEGPGAALANPWFYPSIGEYAGLLERHGLEVTFATLFDRPTPLEDGPKGLAKWLAMFGVRLTERMADPAFVRLVEQLAEPRLFRDGAWRVDYRRLRIVARKQESATHGAPSS